MAKLGKHASARASGQPASIPFGQPDSRKTDCILSGHSDGIIHFLGDNRVLMTNYADFDKTFADEYLRILEKHFDVTMLRYNVKRKHERSWSYINFLQIGGCVLVPQLGIPEDKQAIEQIYSVMPNCEVVGIPALEAVRKGGALNCISWNIKA